MGDFGFPLGDPGNNDPGFLDGVIAAIVGVINYIWAVLVAVANYLFQVLQFIWNFLLTLFQDIKKAFIWLWDNVVKRVLTKAVSAFLKVRQWLSNLLSPIVRFLKALRAWYDAYFNQFVRPILKIIRQFRQILQIFRLLGFKWAARLDADLASIENKIVSVYTTLRGYINTALTYLDLIVDGIGVLRRNPLFAAIIRSAPELQNTLDRATFHTETQKDLDTSNKLNGFFLPDAVAARKATYEQGQLPPEVAAAQAEIRAAMANQAALANQSLPNTDGSLDAWE